MKKILLIAIIMTSLLGITWCSTQLPLATATVKVVDDDGNPVENASARIAFRVGSSPEHKGDTKRHEGLSDKNGVFTATGPSYNQIYYGAQKEGYYETIGLECKYKKISPTRLYWEPYNPELTVVLKKTIEPVPMYARKKTLQMPELNKTIGYDLEIGDWVAPHGKGTKSDFICYATRRSASMQDFDTLVQITFSNAGDGIMEHSVNKKHGSCLISPQKAPLGNYKTEWKREKSARPNGQHINWDADESMNYLFRVRTQLDENGRIISANYGKIYGDIVTGGEVAEKLWLHFTYYYNPNPQSRSLEYDARRNLAEENDKTLAP
jgi:hypothetical protein